MLKIIVKAFVILILIISSTLLAENQSSAFAYLSSLPNSTNSSATNPPATQSYSPCPPNYTPANFPCTVTVGNYTKVLGASQSSLNQSSSSTSPTVPEFGPLTSMIILISIIGTIMISSRFKFHF